MAGQYAEVGEGTNLIDVGNQLMDFYVRTIIEAKLPEIRKAVIRDNPTIDSDYIIVTINSEMEKFIPELSYKFNQIAMLLLDLVVKGQIGLIRDFESKFEDLLERTLLRHTDFDKFMKSFQKKIASLIESSDIGDPDIKDTIGNA